MAWLLACPDWQDRIRTGQSLVPDLPLDEQAAARAVAVFHKLRLPDVPGKPFLKEAAGDWFRDIVRALPWLRRQCQADGARAVFVGSKKEQQDDQRGGADANVASSQ